MAIENVGPGGVTRRGGVVANNPVAELPHGGADPGHVRLSTDVNNNTVLVSGDTSTLLLNSAIASVNVAAQSVPWYVATLLDLSSIVLDTHGKVDLVNNVIENPFYGVSDCYVKGHVRFSASGAGTYRQVNFESGPTVGLGISIQVDIVACAVANATVYSFLAPTLLSSSVRYIGFKGTHDIGATAICTANIELEFFA